MRLYKLAANAILVLAALGSATALLYGKSAHGTAPTRGSAAFEAPAGYVEQEPFPGTRSWLKNDAIGSTIVLFETQMSQVELPPKDDSEYKERLEKGQFLLHVLAGIKNFKIEKIERTQLDDALKVVLVGTYTNAHGDTIRFEKWQYFQKSAFGQIAFNAKASDQFPSRDAIAAALKGYSPFGI